MDGGRGVCGRRRRKKRSKCRVVGTTGRSEVRRAGQEKMETEEHMLEEEKEKCVHS